MLKGIGFTDDDLARPIVGVATTWIETMPCNFNQRELAQRVKAGHPRRRRHADGVQHDLGLGRRLDGHRGHARLADQPRGDRRLDRAGGAGPPVRRAGLPGRLRQDDPGRGDGAVPAGRARARALQRHDRARHLPRPRHHHPGRVRGDRRLCGRADRRGGAARGRVGRLPRRRSLRRPVHGQHDVHGARVPGPRRRAG